MTGNEASPLLRAEMWDLFVGDVIGQGAGRIVHEHRLDGYLVIKVENERESFQNVSEWETWKQVQYTPQAKWFAPCVAISSCGTILIQRKTCKPANYPERVPSFFTDLKLENFGELIHYPADLGQEPQFVAHDYGITRLWRVGLSNRMQVAPWIRR